MKTQKKIILSSPVSTFTDIHPDASDQQVSTLNELSLQYTELKQQQKSAQDQVKRISRKIGEAKRGNRPVDPLKTSMREHSTQLKSITSQLADIENRILAFFEPQELTGHSDQPAPSVYERHAYPDPGKTSTEASIELLDTEPGDWNIYARENPAASIYHHAEWRDLIQNTFGHQGYYFLARSNEGRISGILPLIRLQSRLFGDFLVSMPYFNYGGAIADHPSIEQQLMQAANAHAGTLGVSHIEYRDDIPREGMPVRAQKVNMILQLPGNTDTLWKGFTPKLRAQIKRPQRENPQIKCGGEEYLDGFYSVFARNMRDLGTPVYGKAFFRNILRTFPLQSKIMLICMQKRPVAAGFLIGHRSTLEIPWASTLREVNHLSMNMLLYWSVLKFAVENDYRHFDFGRSSVDSGTFRFKQQWGARPQQLFWHYWLNNNHELPALNPDNPKYALAINIWRRLPLSVTTWLGPAIVRNLP